MKSIKNGPKLYSILFVCGIFLVTSCDVLNSDDPDELKITLSNRTLAQGEAISYTIANNKKNPVFIYINGSVTNIEKKTHDGWTRLINTLPHHPSFTSNELNPNEVFERSITYELIEKLVEDTPGEYRIAYDFEVNKSGNPEKLIASKVFIVK